MEKYLERIEFNRVARMKGNGCLVAYDVLNEDEEAIIEVGSRYIVGKKALNNGFIFNDENYKNDLNELNIARAIFNNNLNEKEISDLLKDNKIRIIEDLRNRVVRGELVMDREGVVYTEDSELRKYFNNTLLKSNFEKGLVNYELSNADNLGLERIKKSRSYIENHKNLKTELDEFSKLVNEYIAKFKSLREDDNLDLFGSGHKLISYLKNLKDSEGEKILIDFLFYLPENRDRTKLSDKIIAQLKKVSNEMAMLISKTYFD